MPYGTHAQSMLRKLLPVKQKETHTHTHNLCCSRTLFWTFRTCSGRSGRSGHTFVPYIVPSGSRTLFRTFLTFWTFHADLNVAAARAVDREFNYNFGSNLGLLGSRRGSNGPGAPVGFIWAEFQLKRSHGDPFHAQNNCLCATSSNSGAPGS